MRLLLLTACLALLPGCPGSHLTGYNLKASVGHTDSQDGQRSTYTGAAIDAHFDVGPRR